SRRSLMAMWVLRHPTHPASGWLLVCSLGLALVAAGCGATASTPSAAATAAAAIGIVSIDQLVADVTASGIDCSDANHTGYDPGATGQVTCGGLAHTIDIETF